MNKKTVVADSSPLIAFGRIKKISLLSKVLGKIIIPETVANECVSESQRPGAVEIQEAIHKNVIQIFPNHKIEKKIEFLEILDEGEMLAISLALQLKMGLLIDEKLGRSAAKNLDLKIIGTAGVLLLAKKKKLIPNVSKLILELEKSGYFLSKQLISEVLKLAKEN